MTQDVYTLLIKRKKTCLSMMIKYSCWKHSVTSSNMTVHYNTHSCVERISNYLVCKYTVLLNTISLLRTYWTPNTVSVCICPPGVSFVMVSPLDSCWRPVGEFLVPRVDTAFPLLTLWEQGAGPVRWFSSETIMCWFTVRGRAVHSHCFLLTGKWLSGLPYRGSAW